MKDDEKSVLLSEVPGRVFDSVVERARERSGPPVVEVVNESLYHERERLRRHGGTPRDAADRAFVTRLRRALPRANESEARRLLRELLDRYVSEILGHFDPRVYAVATRVLPTALGALLNGLSPRRLAGGLRELPTLDKQLVIEGEVDRFRRFAERGTCVLAPTHSSNLDSVILGYVIYKLGLPPFVYGAGLNLFSNPMMGFFMGHLGAYTVDRLKTDPLYKATLKEYATVTLEQGRHSLFFPGGTRSRAGTMERRLKLGLLGCSLVAYRNNLIRRRKDPKLFVFPCTITYPLVLEGATLIEDHLRREGRARYIIVDDEFSRWRRWVDFVRGLFSLDLRIHVRIGEPLDPFGNDVDEDGASLDPKGRSIEPELYLKSNGEITVDPARDAEYTRSLADRLLDRYSCNNVILPTNVLAEAVLSMLRRQSHQPDLYRFLREVEPESTLGLPEVEEEVERLVTELRRLSDRGAIQLGPVVASGDARRIVRQALRSYGVYHNPVPIERRGVRLHICDATTTLYYRNRLDGYPLGEAAPTQAGGPS